MASERPRGPNDAHITSQIHEIATIYQSNEEEIHFSDSVEEMSDSTFSEGTSEEACSPGPPDAGDPHQWMKGWSTQDYITQERQTLSTLPRRQKKRPRRLQQQQLSGSQRTTGPAETIPCQKSNEQPSFGMEIVELIWLILQLIRVTLIRWMGGEWTPNQNTARQINEIAEVFDRQQQPSNTQTLTSDTRDSCDASDFNDSYWDNTSNSSHSEEEEEASETLLIHQPSSCLDGINLPEEAKPLELQLHPPRELATLKDHLMKTSIHSQKDMENISVPILLPTRRPHIQVQIESPEIKAESILDSGCRHSLITKDLVDEVEKKTGKTFAVHPTNVLLQSHTRHALTTLGFVYLTLIITNPEGFKMVIKDSPCLITQQPNETRRLLIGSDFHIAHQAIVHFNEPDTCESRIVLKPGVNGRLEGPAPMTPKLEPNSLINTTQLEFLPSETKVLQLQVVNPTFPIGPDQTSICQIQNEYLGLSTTFVTNFANNGTTRVTLRNQHKFIGQLPEGALVGRLLDPKDFVQGNADLIVQTALTKYQEDRSDECFCQHHGYIGLFTSNGFSDFNNEHSLNFEGKPMSSGPIAFESTTRRIYVERQGSLESLRNTTALNQLPENSEISMAIQGTKLDLKDDVILTLLQQALAKRNCHLKLVHFNTSECTAHQDWHVYFSPTVHIDVSLVPNVITFSPIRNSLIEKDQAHESLRYSFFNNEVIMNTSDDSFTTWIELRLNGIHQLKEGYLGAISKRFVQKYLSIVPEMPSLIISSRDSPTNRLLHQHLQQLQVTTLNQTQIEEYCTKHQISASERLFFVIRQESISELQEPHLCQDELLQLDLVQEILNGAKDDPLKEDIEQLPYFPKLREYKNWTGTYDPSELERQLQKLPKEEAELQIERNRVKDFDDQSEISNMSRLTDTHDLLPTVQGENQEQFDARIRAFQDKLRKELPPSEQEFYVDLIERYKLLFAKTDKYLPRIPNVYADICIKETPSYFARSYPVSAQVLPAVKEILQEAIDANLITKVTNEKLLWISSAFLVPRGSQARDPNFLHNNSIPANQRYRLILDFRRLNEAINHQYTQLPTFDSIVSNLAGHTHVTSVDVSKFYHSISLTERAKSYCGFTIAGGTYQCNVLYEGLSHAVQLAQRIGEQLHEGITGMIETFIDDTLTASDSLQQLRENSERLLQNAQKMNIRLNLEKSQFCTQQFSFLGHRFEYNDDTGFTYQPDPARFRLFADWPLPRSSKDLHRYLGCAAYISRFWPDSETILGPIHALLATRIRNKETTDIVWDETTLAAFRLANVRMASIKPLSLPSGKYDLLFIVDSSAYSCGCCVFVKIKDQYRIAGYFSRRYPIATARSNSSVSKELLSVLIVIKKFEHLVRLSSTVRIATDCACVHALLLKAQTQLDASKANRWVSRLYEYPNIIYVHHVRREKLQLADSLSNRFNLEEIPIEYHSTHEHFLKWTFNKMSKAQIKSKIKEGQEFSLEEIAHNCRSPALLEKKLDFPETPMDRTPTEDGSIYNECRICELPKSKLGSSNPLAATPAASEQKLHSEDIQQIREIPTINEVMSRYDSNYFILKQSKNEHIQKIIEALQTQSPKPAHLKRFHLLNAVLLTRTRNRQKGTDPSNLQIYLDQATFIRVCADTHQLTHCSGSVLKKLTSRYYYTPRAKFICFNIAQSCKVCLCTRLQTKSELPQGVLALATEPSQIFYADFLNLHPSVHKGKRYTCVLTITCGMSCMSFPVMCVDQTTPTVIAVFSNLLKFNPRTKVVVTDNGSSLAVNEDFKSFLRRHGVEPRTIVVKNSSGNLTELFNKQIRRFLRAHCKAYKKPWTQIFDLAIACMNQLPMTGHHKSAASPFEIFFGVPSPVHGDPLKSIRNLPHDHQLLLDALNSIRRARHQLHTERIKAIEAQSNIRPNATVVLKNLMRKSKQDDYYFNIHYRVLKRNGHFVQLINDRDGKQVRTLINRVKLVHTLDASIATDLRPEQRDQYYFKGEIDPDLETPLTIQDLSSSSSSDSTLTDSDSGEDHPEHKQKDQAKQTATSVQETTMAHTRSSITRQSESTPTVTPQQALNQNNTEETLKSRPLARARNLIGQAKSWASRKLRSSTQETTVEPTEGEPGQPELRRSPRLAAQIQPTSVKIPATATQTTIPEPSLNQEEGKFGPVPLVIPPPKRKYTKRFQIPPDQVRRSARLKGQPPNPAQPPL